MASASWRAGRSWPSPMSVVRISTRGGRKDGLPAASGLSVAPLITAHDGIRRLALYPDEVRFPRDPLADCPAGRVHDRAERMAVPERLPRRVARAAAGPRTQRRAREQRPG